jgi:2,4-dienoyl-CoA reductase-like NADH-dependent reductase (Old Yellow Enzyme family)
MNVENARRVLQRERHPHLFRPITLRSVTAKNRIMMSPMCQYSAEEGLPNEWHSHHLAARAIGGAGIVCVEATHVEPRGRITKHCLGLWNDAQRDRLAAITRFVASQGAVPGIQLAHSGRKGSVTRPWEGTQQLGPEDGAWEVIAPSPLPYADGFPLPREMNAELIETVITSFRDAARRALDAGFQFLELHAGHGCSATYCSKGSRRMAGSTFLRSTLAWTTLP